MCLEGGLVAVEAHVRAGRGAAEHGQYLNPGGLQRTDFGPETGVLGRKGRVVVQVDQARRGVEMQGRDDDVRYAGMVGKQWEQRDVGSVMVD